MFFLREKRKCLFCAKLFDQCVPEPLIFGRKHREIENCSFYCKIFGIFQLKFTFLLHIHGGLMYIYSHVPIKECVKKCITK